MTAVLRKPRAARKTQDLRRRGRDQTASARDTRKDLIQAALGLFARHGISPVSLREITQRSGQGNQSAVHYHFRDKAGLVRAVAVHVHGLFQPHLEEATAAIETRERAGTLRDEDLVAALVMPALHVYHGSAEGRDAIGFIARLASEGNDWGQALLMREAAPHLNLIEHRLAPRLPHKPREKLRLQLLLAISSALFGMLSLGMLKHSPFGRNEALYRDKREQSVEDFLDFVCRGVLGKA